MILTVVHQAAGCDGVVLIVGGDTRWSAEINTVVLTAEATGG